MKKRLWKVQIRTHVFGIRYFDLFVLADTESDMLEVVRNNPQYSKDEDAEILSYKEIDLSNSLSSRIL